MRIEDILLKIEKGVLEKNPESVQSALSLPEINELQADDLFQALAKGLETARRNLAADRFSIPEFLLAIDAFKTGVRLLNEMLPDFSRKKRESRIVIGVVEGDVHDLGKNIIASVLDASGYNVFDLGKEITCDMFLAGIKKHDASIAALSLMMSTSLENMKKIIQRIQRDCPGVKTLVGGAALNQQIAMAIGSDGYAESALTVMEEAERILQQS
ncbi:MAG: cobalamin-dependent protein [Desulfobacterales bacterium]